MNNTNRALNRMGILLVGLVLLVVGAGAAAAASVPDWLDAWKTASSTVADRSSDVVADTAIAPGGGSWLLVVVVAACVVLIALLAVFALRQGRGRTRALFSERVEATAADGVAGSVTIDGKVAEQAIQHALDGHPSLTSSSVDTFLVKRTPVLRITANVRRGVSPHSVRTFVDETVAAWDGLLGREIPVLVQINAGLAAKVAGATRLEPQGTTLASRDTGISHDPRSTP